jgi:hypothetical protein
MTETNTERHKRVCYELNRIYDQKNRDYGNSFGTSYKDYGLVMAAIRIGDKYNRLHNLTSRNVDVQHVQDESIRDTLLDLANYAIMTVMEMDAEDGPEPMWEKEVQNG